MDKIKVRVLDLLPLAFLIVSLCGNLVLAVLLERESVALTALKNERAAEGTIPLHALMSLVEGQPPTLGARDAPVTIVLFSDFECPYCRALAHTIQSLSPEHKKQTRIIFRQFPLPIHQQAAIEAEIATCVAKQSDAVFWELYYNTFSPASNLPPSASEMLEYAQRSPKIRASQLLACVDKRESRAMVQHDVNLGKDLGVSGTPTMFINGRRIIGNRGDLPELLDAIIHEDELTGRN